MDSNITFTHLRVVQVWSFFALVLYSQFSLSQFNIADVATPLPARQPAGTILVFGDSISAAYGMDQAQGWVYLLSQRLKEQEIDYQVVNASVSGETTGGGVVRLPKSLQIHHPDMVVIELGGNDGLRGYPIDKISENLSRLIELALGSQADVLLVGMVLPPNYGKRYTQAFQQVYVDLAEKFNIPFLPFLLDGVATRESLLQRDGIHPTPEAQSLLLKDLWPRIQAIIETRENAGAG